MVQFKEQGFSHEGLAVGEFKEYDSSGRLIAKREFEIIKGKSKLNQFIRYDSFGNIIPKRSNFILLDIDIDTVSQNENINVKVSLKAPFFPKSKMRVIFGELDNSYQGNLNFRIDTIESSAFDATFQYNFSQKGNQKIRGIVQEHFDRSDGSSNDTEIRNIYFTKNIYVK
jgi:hypothetical protein